MVVAFNKGSSRFTETGALCAAGKIPTHTVGLTGICSMASSASIPNTIEIGLSTHSNSKSGVVRKSCFSSALRISATTQRPRRAYPKRPSNSRPVIFSPVGAAPSRISRCNRAATRLTTVQRPLIYLAYHPSVERGSKRCSTPSNLQKARIVPDIDGRLDVSYTISRDATDLLGAARIVERKRYGLVDEVENT